MSTLPHARLGQSAIEVSRIALGSWRTLERMGRGEAEEVLGHALARGVDFLDDARYNDETGTAPLVSGYSEVLFGELFRAVGADRDRVKVSNKLWWEFWPAETAVAELEGSLGRMEFERLDLLYSSTLPDDLPVAVALEQIAAVLETGRVGAWGVVNWPAQALAKAAVEAVRLGIPQPCAVQLPYSLARLDWVEDPAMEAALAACDASLVPSATIAGGALTGKYADGATGRLSGELGSERWSAALAIGAALRGEAKRMGVSPATLAVAFSLRHPRAASTLIGATRPAQIDEAIEAIALSERLSDEDDAALRELAHTAAGGPQAA